METTTIVPVGKSVSSAERVRMNEEWKALLLAEFDKDYMVALRQFLASELKAGKVIFPEGKNIFNSLNITPPSKTRVVILGQDPYHGVGQAHGLCFSVQKGVPAPPSLENIFKEIKDDLGLAPPNHGELTKWAEQGVLLLNTCLTVEKARPLSHQSRGWENFTDKVIENLNAQERPLVFMLWGSPAQRKRTLLTNSRHLILAAPHPSPLSAYRGFFGCKHFSKANEFLISTGQDPIDWKLEDA